jgi:hypothetical protein
MEVKLWLICRPGQQRLTIMNLKGTTMQKNEELLRKLVVNYSSKRHKNPRLFKYPHGLRGRP